MAESSVFFTAGFDREAAAVAAALGFPPESVKQLPTPPPLDPKTANVVVVIGADTGSRFGEAPAGGATTTTTAATG